MFFFRYIFFNNIINNSSNDKSEKNNKIFIKIRIIITNGLILIQEKKPK